MKIIKENYRLIKENNGTAIILMLVVVSVLFIFTSFLVRRVVINTTMVEKSGKEQKSYAIAKQGILYALDKLNTWEGTGPDYDSTTWLNGENWDAGNWNSYDLDGDGENEVQIRIDKDDIPHPEDADPAFDSADDDNEDQSYITIESRDSAKKLVTLQAIAKNNSPLLSYVRFINSDTVLEDDFFDEAASGSTSLIQGEAPFCILGNVSWASGSTNNIILSGTESKTLIYGSIVNEGVSSLKINGSTARSNYFYFFDPDDASYDDPTLFDTAEGHYFSSAHLPSCYDYSVPGPSPTYYYGGPQSASWPEVERTRYQNLASGTNCYMDNPDEINKKTEWDDPLSDNTSDDNDTQNEWFQDVEDNSTSWRYYPYAPRLVLNATNISQKLSDGTVNTIDYSSITNNIIYAEGDISVSGIIPDGKRLTFVSGGNIFIDSNLLKETNSASLALLAKQNIVLNPTLRYAVDWASPDNSWQNNPGAALGDPDGTRTYPGTGTVSIPAGDTKTYTLDLDLGRLVTGGRIVLWDYVDGEAAQIDTTLDLLLSRDAASWNTVLSGKDPSGDFHLDFTPQTFRWVRLELRVKNNHNNNDLPFTLSSEGFDAIEVPIYAVDAAFFAEEGNLKVVTGGGVAQDESILPNNNAYQPDADGLKIPDDSGSFSRRLFFWGTLAETEWTESIPDWEYIAYAYDDNLSLNPPPSLPPSVNLVSLKRK